MPSKRKESSTWSTPCLMRSTKTTSTLSERAFLTTSSRTNLRWKDLAFNRFSTNQLIGVMITTKVLSQMKSGNTTSWWPECWCLKTCASAHRLHLSLWSFGKITRAISSLRFQSQEPSHKSSIILSPDKMVKWARLKVFWAQTGTKVLLTSSEKSLKTLTKIKPRTSSSLLQPSWPTKCVSLLSNLSTPTLSLSKDTRKTATHHQMRSSRENTMPILLSRTTSSHLSSQLMKMRAKKSNPQIIFSTPLNTVQSELEKIVDLIVQ